MPGCVGWKAWDFGGPRGRDRPVGTKSSRSYVLTSVGTAMYVFCYWWMYLLYCLVLVYQTSLSLLYSNIQITHIKQQCHVPTKYKQNTALGRWVSTQRAEYKKYCEGEKSNMTSDKIRRLEEVGFAWFMALWWRNKKGNLTFLFEQNAECVMPHTPLAFFITFYFEE